VVVAAVLGATVLACVIDWWARPAAERKQRRASLDATWRRATGAMHRRGLSAADVAIDLDSKRHETATVHVESAPTACKPSPAFSTTTDGQLAALAVDTASLHLARQSYDALAMSSVGQAREARRRTVREEWLAGRPLDPQPALAPSDGGAPLDTINAMAARHLRAIHAVTIGSPTALWPVGAPRGPDDATASPGHGQAIITRL